MSADQHMDLVSLLEELQKMRKAVFVVGFSRPSKEAMSRLKSLSDLLAQSDRPRNEIDLVFDVVGDLSEGTNLTPDLAMELDDIILKTQSDIEAELREAYHSTVTVTDTYRQLRERMTSAVAHDLGAARARAKAIRRSVCLEIITDRPGLYIRQVSDWFNRLHTDTLTYGSIWKYVHELAAEGQILTLGGPQGSPKYCFPQVRDEESRARYYGKPFAAEGVVEREVGESFEPVSPHQFKDFYLLQPEESAPVILVVAFGALQSVDLGEPVKTFGELNQFGHATQHIGFRYEDGEELGSLDMLVALNVARVENGAEENIWFDHEKMPSRSLYPSITDPRVYESLAPPS